MKTCRMCGSIDLRPYETKPPITGGKGQHKCTPECTKQGIICFACKLLQK